MLSKLSRIFLVIVLMCGLFACEGGTKTDNSAFLLNPSEDKALTDEEMQELIDEYDDYDEADRIEAMRSAGARLKTALESIDNPDEPVITVNDIPVTRKTLELQKAMATVPGAASVKEELIQIVRQKVVLSEAKRLGIKPAEESVEQYFEMTRQYLKEGVSGTELILAYVDGLGITADEYLEGQREEIYAHYQAAALQKTLEENVVYDDYVNDLVKKAEIVISDKELLELFGESAQ